MKNVFVLFGLILSVNAMAAANVKDLTLNCQAQAQVESVRNAHYSEGTPANGRFNGIPPSSGFAAIVKVISVSEGCAKLQSKYDLHVDGFTFPVSFGTSEVMDQGKVEGFAKASVGKVFPLELKQYFSYQTKSGWLPLFPKVHGEQLYLAGGFEGASGSIKLEPNLNWVYSLTPIESMSDIQKLSLAEEAVDLLVYNGFWNDFGPLLAQLEPNNVSLKKSYAQLIWGLFHKVKMSKPYHMQVLDFHVGGDGYYQGLPLAAKINGISHIAGIFSDEEMAALIEDLPTMLLAAREKCLNFSPVSLEMALESVNLKFPTLSVAEKGYLKDPLMQVSGKVNYMVAGHCTEGKVTDKAKEQAEKILQSLK